MSNEFLETKKLFQTIFNYDKTEPLTFDQWMRFPDDQKSAVLYLRFYDQITLAWENTKSFYTLTADGVSIVLQYLEKNVPIIKANSNKFNERYIYRVAYNCLYCICHDLIYPRMAYEHETPEQVAACNGDSSFSFYDMKYDETDTIEYQISENIADRQLEIFWNAVERDVDTTVVVEKFLDVPNEQIAEHIKQKFGISVKRIPSTRSLKSALESVPNMLSSTILNLIDPKSDIFDPEFNISEFKLALGQ